MSLIFTLFSALFLVSGNLEKISDSLAASHCQLVVNFVCDLVLGRNSKKQVLAVAGDNTDESGKTETNQ